MQTTQLRFSIAVQQLNSVTTNYEIAQLWNSMAVRQPLSEASLWLESSAPPQST